MKNRIKELRNKQRLSQTELADKIGISQPLISRCEKGFENSKKTNVASTSQLLQCICSIFTRLFNS